MLCRAAVLIALITTTLAEDHVHDHDETFEWIGVFNLGEGETYGLTMSKVDEAYADPAMKFVALEISEEEYLSQTIDHDTEDVAAHLAEDACVDVAPGQMPLMLGACYNLVFNQELYASIYAVVVEDGDEDHDHDHDHDDHDEHEDEHEDEHDHEDDHDHDHGTNSTETDDVHDEDDHDHDHGTNSTETEDEHDHDHGTNSTETEDEHDHEDDHDHDHDHDNSTLVGACQFEGSFPFFCTIEEAVAASPTGGWHQHGDEFGDLYMANGLDIHITDGSYQGPEPECNCTEHDHDHDHEDEDDHDHDHSHEGGVYVAIFAEHFLSEFEGEVHWFKDDHGHDIEPVFEIYEGSGSGGGGGSSNKRGRAWRRSMLATFLVLCCTLVGAVLRLPQLWGDDNVRAMLDSRQFVEAVAAFGAGALFACAVYLMFFESTHMIQARWSEETQATWRFGTMALLGWASGCFPTYFFDHLFQATSSTRAPTQASSAAGDIELKGGKADDAKAGDAADEKKMVPRAVERSTDIHWSLVFSITLGDFAHNFVDGLVIAQSFLDCSASRGWTVAAGTIYHELAQEVSDFALLVNVAGLGIIPALGINVFAGASVMLGAAVYMWTKPGIGGQGLLLSFAGGLYTYLAVTIAAPQFLESTSRDLAHKFVVFLAFIAGTVAIGLVLLDHEHCTADDDGGSGGGGGHGHAHF